ncbi:hypothetical protein BS47DRAFT_1357772 [Hydnum rufescens UP504]|uniref:Uncharacterized protein n=1 Tax=Hydnum rufescens UP504 TaxID=1448309 RepID=A0A9P6B9L9_9AGAM|nr:hypothetical protein BS47DRAFT_1357772 [Hydnum rufescens UP504]
MNHTPASRVCGSHLNPRPHEPPNHDNHHTRPANRGVKPGQTTHPLQRISLPLNEYMPENLTVGAGVWYYRIESEAPETTTHTTVNHQAMPPQMATNEPGERPSESPRQQCPVPHTPLSGGYHVTDATCDIPPPLTL